MSQEVGRGPSSSARESLFRLDWESKDVLRPKTAEEQTLSGKMGGSRREKKLNGVRGRSAPAGGWRGRVSRRAPARGQRRVDPARLARREADRAHARACERRGHPASGQWLQALTRALQRDCARVVPRRTCVPRPRVGGAHSEQARPPPCAPPSSYD